MPIAIDPQETIRFTLERERESDNPTVFLISPPTYQLTERMWNQATVREEKDGYSAGVRPADAFVLACNCHLKGWEEFRDAKGTIIDFVGEKGGASEVDLERLSFQDISEIAQAILELGKVTEEDAGK